MKMIKVGSSSLLHVSHLWSVVQIWTPFYTPTNAKLPFLPYQRESFDSSMVSSTLILSGDGIHTTHPGLYWYAGDPSDPEPSPPAKKRVIEGSSGSSSFLFTQSLADAINHTGTNRHQAVPVVSSQNAKGTLATDTANTKGKQRAVVAHTESANKETGMSLNFIDIGLKRPLSGYPGQSSKTTTTQPSDPTGTTPQGESSRSRTTTKTTAIKDDRWPADDVRTFKTSTSFLYAINLLT